MNKSTPLFVLSLLALGLVGFSSPTIFGAAVSFWGEQGKQETVTPTKPLPVVSSGKVDAADDSGQVTCANTATQLTSKACTVAILVAASANTEDVFFKIGNTVTTSNGSAVPAGAGYQIGIDANLNTLYCISASGAQTLTYTCLVD